MQAKDFAVVWRQQLEGLRGELLELRTDGMLAGRWFQARGMSGLVLARTRNLLIQCTLLGASVVVELCVDAAIGDADDPPPELLGRAAGELRSLLEGVFETSQARIPLSVCGAINDQVEPPSVESSILTVPLVPPEVQVMF